MTKRKQKQTKQSQSESRTRCEDSWFLRSNHLQFKENEIEQYYGQDLRRNHTLHATHNDKTYPLRNKGKTNILINPMETR